MKYIRYTWYLWSSKSGERIQLTLRYPIREPAIQLYGTLAEAMDQVGGVAYLVAPGGSLSARRSE